MNVLHRKLLRDLRQHAGQIVSIALLVGCAITAFVGMRSTRESLRAAQRAYYATYRFAHVFASLKRAPMHLAESFARLPGVSAVETRVVLPATIDVPRLPQLASALLVSVPDRRRAMLNDLHLYQGRYVSADRDDEAIVSVKFAAANSLRIGETLEAVVNGHWKRLHIVGIASSPEYIYEIGPGGFMVDNRLFGIVWMRRDALAAAGGMIGAFNDITLLLTSGASQAAVIAESDHLLEPYGGIGAVGRDRQMSAQIIDGELEQLDALAYVFPLFFLGIAAFLLNVILSRLIASQRREIGTLKAFGFDDRTVMWHYLGFAIMATLLGSIVGLPGAAWLGSAFTHVYADFFGFPALEHRTSWTTASIGIAVSSAAALAGAVWAVRDAARLPPAEAMREAAPTRFTTTLLERAGLAATLKPGGRIVLRNLTRRPLRTAASVVGIGMACAVLVAGMYPFDAVDRIMDIQFRQAQRDNLSVAFVGPRGDRALQELRALPGVLRVEGFRAAGVRIRHGQFQRTSSLLAFDGAASMRSLVSVTGARYALPVSGLVLSEAMADVLHVRMLDTVRIELLERGTSRDVVVAGLLKESIGTVGGYLDRDYLNRLFGDGDISNGAYLALAPGAEPAVYARLKRMPGVAGTSSREALLSYFQRTIADSILISALIVIVAATVIAVGVIYNNSRIAISERGRELASLRVLGFTRREVSALFLSEQAVLTVGGLPIGALAGLAFAGILAAAFATEQHRFPAIVDSSTYAAAIALVVVVAAGVALLVRRRLDRLDLVGTLKTGE